MAVIVTSPCLLHLQCIHRSTYHGSPASSRLALAERQPVGPNEIWSLSVQEEVLRLAHTSTTRLSGTGLLVECGMPQ